MIPLTFVVNGYHLSQIPCHSFSSGLKYRTRKLQMFYFLPKKPKLKLNQNYNRRSRLVKPFIRFIVRVISWRQRRRKVGNIFLRAERLDKSLGGSEMAFTWCFLPYLSGSFIRYFIVIIICDM